MRATLSMWNGEGCDRHWTVHYAASPGSSCLSIRLTYLSHSSQETPDSTLEGIGSFSHRPFSFLSQTPSFGITKR